MTPLVSTTALRIGYRGRAILPAIELSIAPGQTWALVGRNGSGKTTLMRTLLGLLPAIEGRIERTSGLRIAYVPQRGDYDPSVPGRVIDLVRGGLDHGWQFLDPRVIWRGRDAVQQALAAVDALELRAQRFSQLSEGQKQRVLIARALVGDPQMMVLDEPTSAMDPITEETVFALLDRLRTERQLAIVVASHQMSFVPRFATHAALVDREHAVVEIGAARDVLACDAFRTQYGDAFVERLRAMGAADA